MNTSLKTGTPVFVIVIVVVVVVVVSLWYGKSGGTRMGPAGEQERASKTRVGKEEGGQA